MVSQIEGMGSVKPIISEAVDVDDTIFEGAPTEHSFKPGH
jgi:hypothetical protein